MRIVENILNVPLRTFPGGDQFSVLVGRHESTGASKEHTVAVVKLPPGTKSDEHYHKEREESYFFVTGEGNAIIDGVEIAIHAGSLIYTKPKERHAFVNTSKEHDLVYLIITAPVWIPQDSFSGEACD